MYGRFNPLFAVQALSAALAGLLIWAKSPVGMATIVILVSLAASSGRLLRWVVQRYPQRQPGS
jgi:hypothetical protein